MPSRTASCGPTSDRSHRGRPTSLFQVLDAQADALGDRFFLNVDQDAISYAGLRERSERFAGDCSSLVSVEATGWPC
jgi:hypothetical protein